MAGQQISRPLGTARRRRRCPSRSGLADRRRSGKVGLADQAGALCSTIWPRHHRRRSPDKEFILPENLFLIGTMNTADRSIARVDTAMRRRFAFVELDPRIPPVQGLTGRWLTKHQQPVDAARLLDELNRRIADSDAAIGPSNLIGEKIYQLKDGLDRLWQYEIMPLLEDLFYGQRDLDEFYGLSSLRTAIAATPTEP
jgi:5-methylcytosine-specific restriction protein B